MVRAIGHGAPATLAMARRKYARLRRAVEAAGFFALQVQAIAGWDFVTFTSRHVQSKGYGGLILRVTKAAGTWFVSTMHPHHYRLANPRKVAQVIIAVLSRDKRSRSGATDVRIDLTSELISISHHEFEAAIGASQRC
jgi:hypothetical protein